MVSGAVASEAIGVDVAIVGGGPAGLSCCIELARLSSRLNIVLFESEEELGGVPRSCHLFFGMRDLKRIYTGPTYARRLSDLARSTRAPMETEATVLSLSPDEGKGRHRLSVVSPRGLRDYEARFVVLATGCCETPLGTRLIPSARPAGIFTTWQIQQMVYLYDLRPGKRALVIGSEDAALSTVMTLRKAGVAIAGMVEEDEALQTYPLVAKAFSRFYRFPIYQRTSVQCIRGTDRVEGVVLSAKGNDGGFEIECDTVVLTGKFRPISQLIDGTPIVRDPRSGGPLVDMRLETSVRGIFAAGNVLRGGDMHDLCALEGRRVARNIVARLSSSREEIENSVFLRVEEPIRYVVPQRVERPMTGGIRADRTLAMPSVQLARTIGHCVMEARSGGEKVWEKDCGRVIANHRMAIPLDRFDWRRVDFERGIELKVRGSGRESV